MNELSAKSQPLNPASPSREELKSYAKSILDGARDMVSEIGKPYKISYTGAAISTGIGATLTAVAFSKVSKVTKWLSGAGAVLSGLFAANQIRANKIIPEVNAQNKKEVQEITSLISAIEQIPDLNREFLDYLAKDISHNGVEKDELKNNTRALSQLMMFGMDKGFISTDNQAATFVLVTYGLLSHENPFVSKASNVVIGAMTR